MRSASRVTNVTITPLQYSTVPYIYSTNPYARVRARGPAAGGGKGAESASVEHTFYLGGRRSFRGMLAPLEEMQAYHGFFHVVLDNMKK